MVGSGSPLEPEIGFSRAVRKGAHVAVAGTAPIGDDGTTVVLTDVTRWREAARAHGERFATVRPACTFVEVSRFIDPTWLVELELDAILDQYPIRPLADVSAAGPGTRDHDLGTGEHEPLAEGGADA